MHALDGLNLNAHLFLPLNSNAVLSAWIPTHERARAVSLTTSGMYLGSALAMEVLPTVRERLGVLSVQTLLWCLYLARKPLSHAHMRVGSMHPHELSVSLQVAAVLGPAALLRMVGLAGLCWVALWRATMRQVAWRRVELVCMHAHFSLPPTHSACIGPRLPSVNVTCPTVSLPPTPAPLPAALTSHTYKPRCTQGQRYAAPLHCRPWRHQQQRQRQQQCRSNRLSACSGQGTAGSDAMAAHAAAPCPMGHSH